MKMVSSLSILVILVAIVIPLKGQDTIEDCLNTYNEERASVGIGSLVWDTTVAAYAASFASQRVGDCLLVLSPGDQYGESIANNTIDMSGVDAVKSWIQEKLDYDYATNTCAPGKSCGQYTQVVWRNTARVGCAKATCDNGGTFVICSYDPPGNIAAELPF